jgi:hypothetical protein
MKWEDFEGNSSSLMGAFCLILHEVNEQCHRKYESG